MSQNSEVKDLKFKLKTVIHHSLSFVNFERESPHQAIFEDMLKEKAISEIVFSNVLAIPF